MKLNNPKTSFEIRWSILKTFYNGRKIPRIPPIMVKLNRNLKLRLTISITIIENYQKKYFITLQLHLLQLTSIIVTFLKLPAV